ncbi:hypothetical protein ACFQGE_10630 [Halomicroarcula sp. GCM10025817]|uniref:hypothetical protein n=1 Tax=Haloarcula TaxID=2237 RepID=UPI0023E8864D|nr:hypothetical protein [Halomicroarcula sp. SYNS111]
MVRETAQRTAVTEDGCTPSRRQVLAGLGVTAAAGLAGCRGSASGGSESVDCHSAALSHGDGDILDRGVMAAIEGDDVRLAIPLAVEAVQNQNVDRLKVFDASGEVVHVIPVSPDDESRMVRKSGVGDGQLQYEQYLGQRPFHGQYRVVAIDQTGTELDSITVEFNCFPEVDG